MEITIPLFSGISIKFATDSTSGESYPTARLQKGLLLIRDNQDLAEEGVGFGVPVLKRGIQTIFPGRIEQIALRRDLIRDVTNVTVKFRMNLVEKINLPGSKRVKSNLLYNVKNFLAALIRRLPPFRGLLTAASNALRWMFGWQTTFEEDGFCIDVKMNYTVDSQAGIIKIEVDTTNLFREGITEVVVMNEQGAHTFDLYRDSSGTVLRGSEIGCWDKVTSEWASFASETLGLAFTLQQVKGATIFRGRELVGSRLAWSGFGYSFPPTLESIRYQVKIERL